MQEGKISHSGQDSRGSKPPLVAEHLTSGREEAHFPKPEKPEFAFAGRSNVGKSSLINMITGYNKLAFTSNTPGRTRNVEHFLVDGVWYLADLPGYGYAKVSKTERAEWDVMMKRYLKERTNLACVLLLIDVRIKPQANDLEMMRWLGSNEVPFVIAFTKCDKLKKSKLIGTIEAYKKTLLEEWAELPQLFLTSAEKGRGRDELIEFIEGVCADMSQR